MKNKISPYDAWSNILQCVMECLLFQVFTGSCPNNSKELNDANLNFIKTHPLMNDAVPPFFNHPVLVRTGLNMAFTSIAVDPQVLSLHLSSETTSPQYIQVSTPDGSKFDVIFVGTSSGQLLKAVNSLAPKSIASTRTVIIEEIEVTLSLFVIVTKITIIGRWRLSC